MGRAFRNAPPAGAPARASAAAPSAPAPPNTAFVAVDGAGPEVYQRLVKSIRWRALPEQMKHNVLQICKALKEERIAEEFLPQYLEAMALAAEDAPRAPNLSKLGCGALSVLCGMLKVEPPASFAKADMEAARARLKGMPGQGPFEVCKKLHEQARGDLNWLRKQDILGAGSVIMYGKMMQVPMILLRPEVSRKLGEKQWELEVTYVSTTFQYLKPQLMGDIIVRTHWPLQTMPVEFAYEGPESPWYMKTAELLELAGRWGLKATAKDGHDKVRLIVMAKAVQEFERQHAVAMEAAWTAASALPVDQKMTPTLGSAKPATAAEEKEAPDETKEAGEAPMEKKAATAAKVT